MREDIKTLVFAAVICAGSSLLLAGAAAGLKSFKDANQAFDVKRNIVKAFGIDISSMKRPEIEATYEKHVKQETAGDLPIYLWTDEGAEKPSKYAYPISGKGLWGMIYGYMALNSDLETIAGVSFYKHVETPGLGAEIEKSWFQNQFKGKQMFSSGKPTAFKIAKPGAVLNETSVDGISGSTLTGKGVEQLLRKDAARYAEYFNSIKGN